MNYVLIFLYFHNCRASRANPSKNIFVIESLSSSSSSSDGGAENSDEANEDDGDAENDVDDETMSGDNDVNEYTVTMSQPASVLLSDLESLTGTEPESLTTTTMSSSTSALAAAARASALSVTSSSTSRMTSIEDEMLLLRLIDMQSGAEGANAAHVVTSSSARMANR